jgi:hypothetical protein
MRVNDFFLEDWAVSNLVQTNEMAEQMSDVISARELIGRAISNPINKHEYFKFLKYLRSKHGANYSTEVHQQAAKLAKVK